MTVGIQNIAYFPVVANTFHHVMILYLLKSIVVKNKAGKVEVVKNIILLKIDHEIRQYNNHFDQRLYSTHGINRLF